MINRKLMVYSPTAGKRVTEIDLDESIKTWGDLKPVLTEFEVKFSGMKVFTQEKLALEINKAVLPEKDFSIFIMPKKTKSGVDPSAMSYRELRAEIKDIIGENECAKEHFSSDRSYTNKSTDELRKLLTEWNDKEDEEECEEELEHEDEDLEDVKLGNQEDKTSEIVSSVEKILQEVQTIIKIAVGKDNEDFNEELENVFNKFREQATEMVYTITNMLEEYKDKIPQIIIDKLHATALEIASELGVSI